MAAEAVAVTQAQAVVMVVQVQAVPIATDQRGRERLRRYRAMTVQMVLMMAAFILLVAVAELVRQLLALREGQEPTVGFMEQIVGTLEAAAADGTVRLLPVEQVVAETEAQILQSQPRLLAAIGKCTTPAIGKCTTPKACVDV